MTAFMPCKTVFAARPDHPRINGQVECMNCTPKEATVKRYYYDNHQQSREHLYNFLNACNFARRLKTLQKLTPYKYIIKAGETNQNVLSSIHPITRWD